MKQMYLIFCCCCIFSNCNNNSLEVNKTNVNNDVLVEVNQEKDTILSLTKDTSIIGVFGQEYTSCCGGSSTEFKEDFSFVDKIGNDIGNAYKYYGNYNINEDTLFKITLFKSTYFNTQYKILEDSVKVFEIDTFYIEYKESNIRLRYCCSKIYDKNKNLISDKGPMYLVKKIK